MWKAESFELVRVRCHKAAKQQATPAAAWVKKRTVKKIGRKFPARKKRTKTPGNRRGNHPREQPDPRQQTSQQGKSSTVLSHPHLTHSQPSPLFDTNLDPYRTRPTTNKHGQVQCWIRPRRPVDRCSVRRRSRIQGKIRHKTGVSNVK